MSYDSEIVSVVLKVPHGPRLHEIYTWLRNQYGDRDYNLSLWRHHRRKGQVRKYWDYRTNSDDWSLGESEIKFRFGDRSMAMMFKLAWGGRE